MVLRVTVEDGIDARGVSAVGHFRVSTQGHRSAGEHENGTWFVRWTWFSDQAPLAA